MHSSCFQWWAEGLLLSATCSYSVFPTADRCPVGGGVCVGRGGVGGGVLKAVLSVTRTENLVYFYHVNQDRSSNLHQYSEEVLD